MSNLFNLRILAADGIFYDGPCQSLIVPMFDGKYGIMAHHYDTIGAIVPGELWATEPDGTRHIAAVSHGMYKIESNDVLVLVETAERPHEIDANRAKQAEVAAREAMLLEQSALEYHEAQTRLARAVSRLRIHDRYEEHRGKNK